jgi:hypothetical protein
MEHRVPWGDGHGSSLRNCNNIAGFESAISAVCDLPGMGDARSGRAPVTADTGHGSRAGADPDAPKPPAQREPAPICRAPWGHCLPKVRCRQCGLVAEPSDLEVDHIMPYRVAGRTNLEDPTTVSFQTQNS